MSSKGGNSTDPRQKKLLTFGSIGWLLLLIALLLAGVLLRLLLPALQMQRPAVDRMNGFKPELLTTNPGALARGNARDALPPLNNPTFVEPEEVKSLNRHGKYLVPNDRVIGVLIGEEARAYPLSILNWHEVVNDTVGSERIAVTYSPLCDSAVVFRNPPGDFCASGLLESSNLVMYIPDSPNADTELWAQLKARKITSSQSGGSDELEVLPSALMRWGDWLALHPHTVVMSSETGWEKEYNANPYQQYFAEEKIRFPITGRMLPPERRTDDFDRYLIVRLGHKWHQYSVEEGAELAGSEGRFERDGLQFLYRGLSPQMDPPMLCAFDAEGRPLPSITGFKFALMAAGRLMGAPERGQPEG